MFRVYGLGFRVQGWEVGSEIEAVWGQGDLGLGFRV
jgi:hypothetical protein